MDKTMTATGKICGTAAFACPPEADSRLLRAGSSRWGLTGVCFLVLLALTLPRPAAAVAASLVTSPVTSLASGAIAAQNSTPNTAAAAEKREPQAEAEDRGDIRHISPWLDPLARHLHVNRETLWTVIMWLNLAALAYLLYVVLYRSKAWSLPGSMRQRTEQIHESMAQAERAHDEALKRLNDVEARLNRLQDDIATLRQQAATEAEAEYQRIMDEAQADSEKLARQGRAQIETLARSARLELQAYAADLAVQLAEEQIRRQLTPELDRHVVSTAAANITNGNRKA